ncbi:MAG: methyl-accepting chemotaxis protein, partial [Spirochaetia bacterium]|nr:methyl-accepting chemotaxis protein [Spirochaetia bacterium]
ISFLIVSLNLILFFRSFAAPIMHLRDNLSNLSEGDADLSARLDITTRDEFGEMAYKFNEFIDRIREIVVDTNSVANNLRNSGQEMVDVTKEFESSSNLQTASMEEITAAVDQMASQVDGIAGRAKLQLDDVLSLSDTLQHWNSITKKMEVTLEDILKYLDRSTTLATEGDKELQQTENSIITIAESAERISQIVEIIEDIADKIELLALNAAIEAARAGESGRGFAIVSSEISKLAEMTTGSIQEISRLVQQNNTQVESGVNSVNTTVSTIEEIISGTKHIAQRMKVLDELMKEQVYINGLVQHDSNDVRMQAQGISDATSEQKKGIQSIMNSVEMIRHVSEKTVSGAQNINKNAVQNEKISKQLSDKVKLFSV